MPWYLQGTSGIPTWVQTTPTATTSAWTGLFGGGTSAVTPLYTSATASTTCVTPIGNTVWWSNTSDPNAWAYQQQAMQAQLCQQQAQLDAHANQQRAVERYYFNLGLTPQQGAALDRITAPAIITHQEQQRRDEEAYRRALAEHDEQEATRIRLQIEFRERSRAEQLRLQAEAAARNQEAERERQAATARARELLLEHLSPAQRDTFTKNGWFIVQGGRSGKQYRIRCNDGISANVDVVGARHRLCAHVATHRGVPMGDHLLAQKMMLEYDEDAFLRIANRHG